MALLGKWKWRLGSEDISLWKQVLESKYGSWRELDELAYSKFDSWWLKDIKKICESNSNSWFDMLRGWKIGQGSKIRFWTHKWLGNDSLKNRYLRIFMNFVHKEGTLKKFGGWHESQWLWRIPWRRKWFQWELQIVNSFMEEPKYILLHTHRNDSWFQLGDTSNSYSIKFGYDKLLNYTNSNMFSQPNFNFVYFWNIKALPSAHYFA